MQLVGLDVIDFLLHLVKKHNTFRLPFDPPYSSSPQIFWKIKEFKATKCFTHNRTANTIQLLVAVKTNFSGLFFFWTSSREGNEYSYLFKIGIKKWTKTCLKWHDGIRTNSSCCNIYTFGIYILQHLYFLLLMCKKRNLSRSTNILIRNYLTLCFLLRGEGRQCPILRSKC